MEGINPRTMGDDVLLEACVGAIRRAAAGESRGGDDRTYRFAMELMAEAVRRHAADGHTRRCRSDIYSRAFEKVTAAHAGRVPETLECTCGGGRS